LNSVKIIKALRRSSESDCAKRRGEPGSMSEDIPSGDSDDSGNSVCLTQGQGFAGAEKAWPRGTELPTL
jgi:hypothetical protein